MPVEEKDPFLDDEFSALDTRDPGNFATELAKIADENPDTPGLEPEVPEPVAIEFEPEPEPQPEVIDAGDGMTVSIEKTAKGWRAVLDANTGARPEVYEGKTQKEVLQNALVGKVHATKKINQLNRQVKLQTQQVPQAPAPVQDRVEQSIGRPLTADEQVQFNVDYAKNPAQAMEAWFIRRVGMAPERVQQIATTAEETNNTSLTALCAQEAKEFLLERPDYYSIDDNYHSLLKYIVNQKNGDAKARQFVSEGNYDALSTYLTARRLFTSENLAEAYDELSEAGLLEVNPEEETATPQPPVPVPPMREKARPTRAAKLPGSYGLRTQDTAAPPPRTETAPSVDELDNQSDEEIEKLFNATRQYAARTRRN